VIVKWYRAFCIYRYMNKVIIVIIIIIIITTHAGVRYLQPPGRVKVSILHFSDFFEFKSIQHLNSTQISSGVDSHTVSQQNRMTNLNSNVRNTENSESERDVKSVTSISLWMRLTQTQTSRWLQLEEGTLWILSLCNNLGIYSCAVYAFLEISRHLFLPYLSSLLIRNDFTDLLFNVCSHYMCNLLKSINSSNWNSNTLYSSWITAYDGGSSTHVVKSKKRLRLENKQIQNLLSKMK